MSDDVKETLVDCMTSFGIPSDRAALAAEYILSEYSGLVVTVDSNPSRAGSS